MKVEVLASGRIGWISAPELKLPEQQIKSFAETLRGYTIHFTDAVRQNDVLFGMVSAVILSAGDAGAEVLQALINGGDILRGKLPSREYFNAHLNTNAKIDNYFASKCTYKDSYYFGKMLGDIICTGVGVGMTTASIFEMMSGVGVTGIGTATAPTGVGVGIAAVGAAVTAKGVATAAAGINMAMSAAGNFGGDKRQFDYYQKLACDNSEPKGSKGGQTSKVTSNLGNEIDITPSPNHTITTKNPGLKGTPNSSIDIVDSAGNIKTRRWFGSDGTQIRDVDFTNHGNAKLHPEWPHVHGPR